jgi:NAD-specific glutamate dehydrogenase
VALPIIDVAESTGAQLQHVAEVFSGVASELGLDWLMDQLSQLPASGHWQSMERDSLVDDITTHQGMLAARCLTQSGGDVRLWLTAQERFALDWGRLIEEAQQASVQDFSMFSMTCRKLGDLCRSI